MTTGMNTKLSDLSTAAKLNVTGLLGFGAVIVVQIAGGVDAYPVIPPGLVISLVVVAVVVASQHRWPSILGAVWPLFLVVGAVLAGQTADWLSGDDGSFVLVTAMVQAASLLLALGAGLVAVVQRYRPPNHG